MKWITRERARVDRIACPWLITRFVDSAPEFLFVPPADVMAVAAREHAIPYDVPDVELGHHGPRCSFDAFVERYDLDDPALAALAVIVRGADTDHRDLTSESAGLYAAATGFQAISRDDHDNMARQFPLYDALYDFCRTRAGTAPSPPRVLFVCLHGAAKSVVAAAHFRALAKAQGLELAAVAAGTEPDPELTPAAVKGLAGDGLIPVPARPRPVTLHDLRTATRIVSFGCDVTSPGVGRWSGGTTCPRSATATTARAPRSSSESAGWSATWRISPPADRRADCTRNYRSGEQDADALYAFCQRKTTV